MVTKNESMQSGSSETSHSPFRGLGGKGYAIQGYEGSFHQEATRQFFGKDAVVIPCATFRDVVKAAANKKESDGGVMAIENSIAGSILPNYHLLQRSNLRVIGEVYLHIKQNLLVNHGVKLEDIREVHSHTMALQQCHDFLDKYKWKLVERFLLYAGSLWMILNKYSSRS